MKNAVKRRKIDYIWHFTKIENLDSILQNGLIPRATLEANNANMEFNDLYRLDGHTDASCLSIGHPNYKMFYRLRMEDREQEWAVVAVKRKALWRKDCAFCYENAASNEVTSIPLLNRKGVPAFERLFIPTEGKPDRATLGLPDNCPTNPQAEVLVFGVIEPNYISGAILPNKERENEYKAKYPNYEFLYHRAFYSARLDYQYW